MSRFAWVLVCLRKDVPVVVQYAQQCSQIEFFERADVALLDDGLLMKGETIYDGLVPPPVGRSGQHPLQMIAERAGRVVEEVGHDAVHTETPIP